MKNIWITGGGSGIGQALAKYFVKEGHTVFISGRHPQKLQDAVQGAIALPCDITDQEQVKTVISKMGQLDLAILNAGTYMPGLTSKTSIETFRKTMEVNYFGTLNCILSLLPDMNHKGGHLVVVGSIAGYRGLPNSSGYGPSKAAVISLCESIRAELDSKKVKFQLVNPGFVKSPLTEKNDFEMPFLLTPNEAAAEIIKGMKNEQFEIAFPSPFVRRMKFLRLLPYKFFFPLIKKVTGQ